MGRRRVEIQFGSDSFLDVVCNVVGILVILIVLTGLRISRAPRTNVASGTEEPIAIANIPEVTPPPIEISADSGPLTPVPPPPPVSRPALAPTTPPVPPRQLVAEVEALSRLLEQKKDQLGSVRSLAQSETTTVKTLSQHVLVLRSGLANEQRAFEEGGARIQRLQDDVAATAHQIDVLREAVEEAEQTEQPATEFRHRMTPVGRVVNNDELHFRLSGNRVSVVPVEVLALRLQDHLTRHRDAVLKLERFEGAVGPFEGYQMKYLVERQTPSLVEELKHGQGMVRFGVSLWVIEPTNEIHEETTDEALRPSSRFAAALQTADSRTTLTFWVYPDSFKIHRELQQAAHANQFEVASRPLPFRVPITGSRHGSRSSAQ